MPLLRAESPLPTIGESTMPYIPPESPVFRPIGEGHMPYIPSAPAGKAGDMPYAPASKIPPETGFGRNSPFTPFPPERDMSLERARQQHRLRLKSSPPMLGQDLTFRRCPSPKQTKLEPDHLWDVATGTTLEDHNRDPTEEHGLWRGYCYTADPSEKLVPAERLAMLTTPAAWASSNNDPFSRDFEAGLTSAPITFSEEPASLTPDGARGGTHSVPGVGVPEHRTKSAAPKGLHMLQNLQNLDEKLKREKAAADREEQIAAEFDEHFVSQVYNYLSLGYPATARQYDGELAKISRIPVSELEKGDQEFMESLWGLTGAGGGPSEENGGKDGVGGGGGERRAGATGHIMLDSEAKDGVKEEDRCHRWKALKLYISLGARPHPVLNAISRAAWGVQERWGSWGI